MNPEWMMKMKPRKAMKWYSFLVLGLAGGLLQAQEENLGRLQLEVVERYAAKMGDVEKPTGAQPPMADSAVRKIPVRYQSPTFPLKFEPEMTPIKPVRISKVPIEAIPRLQARLALGSFGTIHGDVSYSGKRSSQWQWNTFLNHRSTRTGVPYIVYDKNPITRTELGASGRYFFKDYSMGGQLRYAHQGVNYYGYPNAWFAFDNNCTDCDYALAGPAPRRDYNLVALEADFISRKALGKQSLTKAALNYHNLSWSPTNTENFLGVYTDWAIDFRGIPLEIGANVEWDRTQFANEGQGNNWLNVNLFPRIKTNIDQVYLRLGLNMFVATDRTGGNTFRFYPVALAEYAIVPDALTLFGGLEGKLETYHLRRLVQENPYLNNPDVLQYGHLDAYVGLRGKITGRTSYQVKGGAELATDMPFFYRPDSTLGLANSFEVLNDAVTRFFVSGQVAYESGPVRVALNGTYQSFVMDQLAEAFHRANFDADIVGYYRLQRKLAVFSRWYYVGRRPVQAMDLSAVRPSTIAGYVDGSIGAEYQFNDLIGFDASINNLLSNPYDIWEGYQAQRIRFMLGLSIRW
jgi:hypothetical protein